MITKLPTIQSKNSKQMEIKCPECGEVMILEANETNLIKDFTRLNFQPDHLRYNLKSCLDLYIGKELSSVNLKPDHLRLARSP